MKQDLCIGVPFTLFIESLKADETRVRYKQRLRKFLSIVGYNTEEFAALGKSDPGKLSEVITTYILTEKGRVRSGEIRPGTKDGA